MSLIGNRTTHVSNIANDVLSQTATTIVGQNVTIDAAVGSTDTTQTQSVHTGGINVGIGGAAAGLAATAYHDVPGASQGSSDPRLKALYAAKAAYDAKDLSNLPSQGLQGASKDNPSGINLQVGIGGSTAMCVEPAREVRVAAGMLAQPVHDQYAAARLRQRPVVHA